MTTHSPPSQAQLNAKLITCVLPDTGIDKILMKSLRSEKQIIRSSSGACRGISTLLNSACDRNNLPVATLARMVKVVVSEDEADELFDYIYNIAGIGQTNGGYLYMGRLTNATLFELPADVPDEAESE